jgi:hypothetical protein
VSLSKFKPRSETILAGDDPVTIYGLTVSDVSTLVFAYGDQCKQAYAIFQAASDAPDMTARVNRTLIEVANLVPDFTAAVICLAAREPDAMDQAKSLPFTVQIDALVKIVELTLGSEGGLGNFLAVVQRAASMVTQAAKPGAPQNSLLPTVTQ